MRGAFILSLVGCVMIGSAFSLYKLMNEIMRFYHEPVNVWDEHFLVNPKMFSARVVHFGCLSCCLN